MDELHQRSAGTAGRNFRQHKDKLFCGVDYWEIEADEFRRLELGSSNSSTAGIVLSETGYCMVVKSLQDPLAWDVQRALVTGYFRRAAPQQDSPAMLAILDRLVNGQQSIEHKHDEFREEVTERFDKIEHEISRTQRRKPPSKATQEIFAEVIFKQYHGLCPCCKETKIFADEKWLNNRTWEHFFANYKNHRTEMWVTCFPCNVALENSKFRQTKQSAFDDFQEWVGYWSQPLFELRRNYLRLPQAQEKLRSQWPSAP